MMNDHDAYCPARTRDKARCQCALITLVRSDYVHTLSPAEQAALDEIRAHHV
jgi:hypothetical protein